ncbi:MAG: metallophosphoesterase [Proteobacteria bacterium]|nr:metallophosphoesterase [Pseudomonadota bacterium]
MRSRLRAILFADLMRTLSVLLGLTQFLIGHWVVVVLAGREGPGLLLGSGLAALLVALNLWARLAMRSARQQRGWPRRFANAYRTGGLATLLLGVCVAFSWIGLLPLAALLASLGVDRELAFELFRTGSVLVVGALFAMVVWGFTGGQARIECTRIRVAIPGMAAVHRGLRIVQLSDFHIGNGLEGERLDRLVRQVNDLDADLLALTGDLFDFDPTFVEAGARSLSALRARLGVFAVLGNHDTYTGTETVTAALASHAPGIRLLRGEVVRLPLDPPLYVAGVDDPGRGQNWTKRNIHIEELEALGRDLPEDGPVLLLVHRPEAFPQAARLGFPLVLAGHTHGGQIALPTPGGRFNLARIVTPFHRGLYRENGSVLYVNRGIGVAGPAMRFNCAREIATIELA